MSKILSRNTNRRTSGADMTFLKANCNKQATLKNYNKFSCFMVWKYQLIDQIRITKGEHEK